MDCFSALFVLVIALTLSCLNSILKKYQHCNLQRDEYLGIFFFFNMWNMDPYYRLLSYWWSLMSNELWLLSPNRDRFLVISLKNVCVVKILIFCSKVSGNNLFFLIHVILIPTMNSQLMLMQRSPKWDSIINSFQDLFALPNFPLFFK